MTMKPGLEILLRVFGLCEFCDYSYNCLEK